MTDSPEQSPEHRFLPEVRIDLQISQALGHFKFVTVECGFIAPEADQSHLLTVGTI